MQTPAGTWITTTSLIDLWIIAASEARWKSQKGKGPLPDTSQVRAIMADMAAQLGLTLTEERRTTLLRQAE